MALARPGYGCSQGLPRPGVGRNSERAIDQYAMGVEMTMIERPSTGCHSTQFSTRSLAVPPVKSTVGTAIPASGTHGIKAEHPAFADAQQHRGTWHGVHQMAMVIDALAIDLDPAALDQARRFAVRTGKTRAHQQRHDTDAGFDLVAGQFGVGDRIPVAITAESRHRRLFGGRCCLDTMHHAGHRMSQ